MIDTDTDTNTGVSISMGPITILGIFTHNIPVIGIGMLDLIPIQYRYCLNIHTDNDTNKDSWFQWNIIPNVPGFFSGTIFYPQNLVPESHTIWLKILNLSPQPP